MNANGFAKSSQVGAAWINVEPLLATKRRGDELLRADVQAAAGDVSVRRLESRIRKFYLRTGIDLIAVVGRGWKLPTDEEQVRDRAEHHRVRAKRETKRELLAAGSVDDAALNPETRRLRDLHVRHASAQITSQRAIETERRAILGAPAALPRLPPNGDNGP